MSLSPSACVSLYVSLSPSAYVSLSVPLCVPQFTAGCGHAQDPPAPVLRGVERWDWPVFEGFERFCGLVDSEYHGLNLCCGTAAEGLGDPKTELIPLVK